MRKLYYECNKSIHFMKEIELKLSYFLKNPGYFSTLVLGDSGVGKEFLINKVIKELNEKAKVEKKTKVELNIYYLFELEENLLRIFKEDEEKYEVEDKQNQKIERFIVIKNVEELSLKQQNLLFNAMSTSDGKIGPEGSERFYRMIFTSSFNVESLRSGDKSLSPRFWNRISQLVLKVPSFKDSSINIRIDFKSVWKKMKFEAFNKLPEDEGFYSWLESDCNTFAGNFRDLDTIAILFHQYRIIYYEGKTQKFKKDIEERIFNAVKKDFRDFAHFPTQKLDGTNTFEFKTGESWDNIEQDFRSSFKKWAKDNYGTLKVAIKELNMPSRKMDKW